MAANALGSMVKAPCRGKCKGTDRTEPPARYGRTHANERGIYCECCEQWLMLTKGVPTVQSPPGADPGTVKVLECQNCEYLVESLSELR